MEHTVAPQESEVRKRYLWDPSWLGKVHLPTVINGAGHWPQ